jgi:hypothetical protein
MVILWLAEVYQERPRICLAYGSSPLPRSATAEPYLKVDLGLDRFRE